MAYVKRGIDGRFKKFTQDDRDYVKLIEKVRKIDEEAAEYLETCATDVHLCTDGELARCFIWSTSPQGHDFWEEIEKRLGQD